jgi:hypothetical protein
LCTHSARTTSAPPDSGLPDRPCSPLDCSRPFQVGTAPTQQSPDGLIPASVLNAGLSVPTQTTDLVTIPQPPQPWGGCDSALEPRVQHRGGTSRVSNHQRAQRFCRPTDERPRELDGAIDRLLAEASGNVEPTPAVTSTAAPDLPSATSVPDPSAKRLTLPPDPVPVDSQPLTAASPPETEPVTPRTRPRLNVVTQMGNPGTTLIDRGTNQVRTGVTNVQNQVRTAVTDVTRQVTDTVTSVTNRFVIRCHRSVPRVTPRAPPRRRRPVPTPSNPLGATAPPGTLA